MKNKLILKFLLLVAIIAAAVIFFRVFSITPEQAVVQLRGLTTQFGVMAPVVFMLIYILGTVLFFPGSILTIIGGVLFGPVLGTFINLTGATIGATFSFIIARYFCGNWAENKTAGKIKTLKSGIEKEGWRFVVVMRLVPLVPFNALNYALGLTKIPVSHNFIASYIAMFPGCFAYTYLGHAGAEATKSTEALINNGLIALALLAMAAYLPRLIKKYRHSKENK